MKRKKKCLSVSCKAMSRVGYVGEGVIYEQKIPKRERERETQRERDRNTLEGKDYSTAGAS